LSSRSAALALALLCAAPAVAQSLGPLSQVPADAFEAELYKTRFEQEVKFRAAAIQVAWGAEHLCDHTTEIEPFVLWSVHSMRKPLAGRQEALFRRVTGMDEKWRLVWADESVPDEARIGDVVVAINGMPLPGGSTRVELGALFRGNAMMAGDDQGLWDVIAKAREQAVAGRPMTLHFEGGRTVEVSTQTGCAGRVTASAFDADPDKFVRQGNERAKIPAVAMIEARSRDEFRWLAAFGTYFQASAKAVDRQQTAQDMSSAFTVGKVLLALVPGAGMVLSAAEARAERAITVDGLRGSADLFANEVVVALGGEPDAGLRFLRRLRQVGQATDVFAVTDFRLGSMEEHVRRLRTLQAAAAAAAASADTQAPPASSAAASPDPGGPARRP